MENVNNTELSEELNIQIEALYELFNLSDKNLLRNENDMTSKVEASKNLDIVKEVETRNQKESSSVVDKMKSNINKGEQIKSDVMFKFWSRRLIISALFLTGYFYFALNFGSLLSGIGMSYLWFFGLYGFRVNRHKITSYQMSRANAQAMRNPLKVIMSDSLFNITILCFEFYFGRKNMQQNPELVNNIPSIDYSKKKYEKRILKEVIIHPKSKDHILFQRDKKQLRRNCAENKDTFSLSKANNKTDIYLRLINMLKFEVIYNFLFKDYFIEYRQETNNLGKVQDYDINKKSSDFGSRTNDTNILKQTSPLAIRNLGLVFKEAKNYFLFLYMNKYFTIINSSEHRENYISKITQNRNLRPLKPNRSKGKEISISEYCKCARSNSKMKDESRISIQAISYIILLIMCLYYGLIDPFIIPLKHSISRTVLAKYRKG